MRILIFGDVVAKPGRKAIAQILPRWHEEYQPDLVIANAENLSHGIGATPSTIKELQTAGVELFTSGNHIWKKPEAIALMEVRDPILLRPANYPPQLPGTGERLVNVGARQVLVINLMGRVFFRESLDCPFRGADEILTRYHLREDQPRSQASQPVDGILVDFHAEASSEKNALGRYLDGRITAFWGTHTHVPSGDSMILKGGTAYRNDIGMTGLKDSVIGANTESIIKQFLTQMGHPEMHDVSDTGEVIVNGQILECEGREIKQWKSLQENVMV